MDTARAASIGSNATLVLMPTVTATNAATSIVAMIYDKNHVAHAVFIDRDLAYVIADTNYINLLHPHLLNFALTVILLAML